MGKLSQNTTFCHHGFHETKPWLTFFDHAELYNQLDRVSFCSTTAISQSSTFPDLPFSPSFILLSCFWSWFSSNNPSSICQYYLLYKNIDKFPNNTSVQTPRKTFSKKLSKRIRFPIIFCPAIPWLSPSYSFSFSCLSWLKLKLPIFMLLKLWINISGWFSGGNLFQSILFQSSSTLCSKKQTFFQNRLTLLNFLSSVSALPIVVNYTNSSVVLPPFNLQFLLFYHLHPIFLIWQETYVFHQPLLVIDFQFC